ncbi:MAG: N-6 DNA methylase [Alphaproteobacteria bacterium]|nr:N-6 DNA methylase [Alphaproteobacteria bacterium]
MTLDEADPPSSEADWLFAIGEGSASPEVDGLVAIDGYDPLGRPPEEVGLMERARDYGAFAVFFEASRHGRAPVAQALVFKTVTPDDNAFAKLHQRLWSWGGVPLVFRASPGLVQLFRCAHEPDFVQDDGTLVCNPIRTLSRAADIAAEEEAVWWSAARIRNGTIWDDPDACKLMLSADKSAHRALVEQVRALAKQLNDSDLLEPPLRRRLLILALLIAYLEERCVLLDRDFSDARQGATKFFHVLSDGPAVVSLLEALEERFNGHVFRLRPAERTALLDSNTDLASYAKLVEGLEDPTGQLSLWRRYSFRDLPVELISNIYQLFVKDPTSSIYTPPALVRLMIEEALSWNRLDALIAGDDIILDPACGSGVFLVEAYRRLVLHWRWRNDWADPTVDDLIPLLHRLHGVDVEEGAIELAAFSLCLSLCDALRPEEIRASVNLFPPLAGETLHRSCFFEAKEQGLLTAPIAAVVGNPPFKSELKTSGAKRRYDAYAEAYKQRLPDKQIAYLFLHEAMEILRPDGILALIEPAGFLYNQSATLFRHNIFSRWSVREILDFVSVRGLFKKGDADPKVVVVLLEAKKPASAERVMHAVFRRNGRATAEQGFDIDYYDLHWVQSDDARESDVVWKSNLLGGRRVRDFVERLRQYPTLEDMAKRRDWNFGEGYIAGQRGIAGSSEHLIGKPLLPTKALSKAGIDDSHLGTIPHGPIEAPRTAALFTPPFLLVKKHEDLHHGLWQGHYLAYKSRIVGFASKRHDLAHLKAIEAWLEKEPTVLRAYIAGISTGLFVQRATAILAADIFALPYPEDENLDLSVNERIVAQDIVEFQREFIRRGTSSALMQCASEDALDMFNEAFTAQINTVYARQPLRQLDRYHWAGAICSAYVFGDGGVDWSGAGELQAKLDVLLRGRTGASLTVTRIARLYDRNFLFLLKPDRLRFWTRSIALCDADDVLADLRSQGF